MKISVPKDLNSGNVFPAGIFRFRINETPKVDKAANSDNLIIKPAYTCVSPTSPNGDKIAGRKVFDNWTVAPQCLSIWNTAYKALVGEDLPAGDFEIDEFVNLVTSNVTGKECILEVTQYFQKKVGDSYVKCGADDPEAQARNGIKKVLPVGGATESKSAPASKGVRR